MGGGTIRDFTPSASRLLTSAPTLPPTLSHIISWEEWLAPPTGTDIPTALEALINHSGPLAESIRETWAGRAVRTRT